MTAREEMLLLFDKLRIVMKYWRLKNQIFKWKEEEIEIKVQKIAKEFKTLIGKICLTQMKILRHFAEVLASCNIASLLGRWSKVKLLSVEICSKWLCSIFRNSNRNMFLHEDNYIFHSSLIIQQEVYFYQVFSTCRPKNWNQA